MDRMERASPRWGVRPPLAVLAITATAMIGAYLLVPSSMRDRALLSDVAGIAVGLIAGAVILLAHYWRGSWRAALSFGMAMVAVAGISAVFLAHDLVNPPVRPYGGSALLDLGFVVVAAMVLWPLRHEMVDHFVSQDRREITLDIALISVAASCLGYFALRPSQAADFDLIALSCVVLAGTAVSVITGWAVLTLWVPSRIHVGVLLVATAVGGAALAMAYQWVRHDYTGGQAGVDIPIYLGCLALAGVVAAEPALRPSSPVLAIARRRRPVLTSFAIAAACGALAFIAVMQATGHVSALEASALILLLGVTLTARILVNQIRSTRAGRQAHVALADKDRALRETDAALGRLRELNETLRESEERLRLLFDAAADGIVELDGHNVIRRANEAFCQMMELPSKEVVGESWSRMAGTVKGAGLSLEELPVVGQATIGRIGQDLHLEARSSELPGPDAGRLMVVRDVTPAKVADQTIRSLFKFLQDRDEDRTRLLERTNTAIEAERNRIARDLHDGPVQGVSAATLSLEAVLLMIGGGRAAEATAVLTKIREELAEEADNLRRLMGDLRPPVLDERGLVPALREVLARFGRDFDMRTSFASRSLVDVPPEVETLAYRIVQEALTNAGKHSRATEVRLSVEAVAGQLRIEVEDDGQGFDPGQVRNFLRAGRVGLASMRERTELANGSFLLRSGPGSGTTIVATLPLDLTHVRAEPALT